MNRTHFGDLFKRLFLKIRYPEEPRPTIIGDLLKSERENSLVQKFGISFLIEGI